jgi:hypothetical protein
MVFSFMGGSFDGLPEMRTIFGIGCCSPAEPDFNPHWPRPRGTHQLPPLKALTENPARCGLRPAAYEARPGLHIRPHSPPISNSQESMSLSSKTLQVRIRIKAWLLPKVVAGFAACWAELGRRQQHIRAYVSSTARHIHCAGHLFVQ